MWGVLRGACSGGRGCEKGFDTGDVGGDAVGRERLEKDLAVALGGDTGVEKDKDAAVFKRADEAAKSLLEGEDSFGNLVVEKRTAAGFFDGAHAGLDDGVGGNSEGQAVDDDAAERFALNVDALPEAGGAEEDGVGSGAEFFEEGLARSGAVKEQRKVEDGKKKVVEGAHLVVAGEKAKGAAASDAEDTLDGFGRGWDEFGIARVGHVGREIEQRLLAVLEVRGDDELARAQFALGEPEPAAEMLKAALDRERGGSEDDGGYLIEDELAKKLGDVNGRGLDGAAHRSPLEWTRGRTGTPVRRSLRTPLEPEDHVGSIRFEHELEVGAETGGAIFEAGNLIEIGDAIELGFDQRERGTHGEVEIAGGFEEFFAVGEGMAAVGGHGEGGKKEASALAKLLGKRGNLRGGGVGARKNIGVAGEIFEAKVGERAAEVLRGNVFELVRLVEDDGGGFGQNSGVGGAAGGQTNGGVGEEQVVIDDDEVGLEGAAAHLGDEAAAIVGAGRAKAGIGAGVELVPESGGFGQGGELGAVAGFGDPFPFGNLAILFDFVEARENGLVAEGEELAAAKIVGATFHVADAELTQESFEEGDIAEEELVLEGLGSGGNDDAPAGAERGQEVCESLAGPCASFDDEMAALREGALDSLGHFVLAGAILERQRRAGEDAAGREEFVEGGKNAG